MKQTRGVGEKREKREREREREREITFENNIKEYSLV